MKLDTHSQKLGRWTVLALSISSTTLLFASPQLAPIGGSEIAEFIQMDMRSDNAMSGTDVIVRMDDDTAILTGTARTMAQTERAAARAIATEGVRAVVNQVRIAPAEGILEKAKSALAHQKMFPSEKVIVTSTGSGISLSGQVGSADEKELAREVVSEVPGVVVIRNELAVTFTGGREDSQIEEQLRFITKNDPLCTGLTLKPSVQSGVVTWRGEVGSRAELARLVRRSQVSGVRDVRTSGVRIDGNLAMEGLGDKAYSNEESLTSLRDALDRDSRVNSKSVRVKFENGIVSLKGEVASLGEKEAVESSARCVPGVLRVSNDLEITENPTPRNEMKFTSPPVVKPRH